MVKKKKDLSLFQSLLRIGFCWNFTGKIIFLFEMDGCFLEPFCCFVFIY